MIRLGISHEEAEDAKFTTDKVFYRMWWHNRLKKAGIPIINGPLLPVVDFSKGSLDIWGDIESGNTIYVWKTKNYRRGIL